MATEHIKTWRVGDVEVTRIVEINGHHNPLDFLLADGTPEMILEHEWLFPHFALPDGDMTISFQCFLVRSHGRAIVVDTCIGAGRTRAHEFFAHLDTDLLADLTAAGAPPESIDTVVCTHLHDDHTGWNTHLVDGQWVPSFPNARYLFVDAELDHWTAVRSQGHRPEHAHFADAIDPIVAAGLAQRVDPNHAITDEVRLMPSHGHTPGHVSIAISSNGHEAVITGDLMHHPVQIVHPRSHANFDSDPVQGGETRAAFVERYANTDTLIIGTHFCDPTVGHITGPPEARRFTVT
jgi:glyoxylase-like metal-dependent hydrolase (beta-lactamase superfamily II)